MKQKTRRAMRVARYVVYRETMVNPKEIFVTFVASFVGIGLIGLFQSQYLELSDSFFLIGSFGASAVLVYGVPTSPLAQPRNVMGGHLFSAIIGVTIAKIFVGNIWLSAAFAVSLSIVIMQITKTLHPPGGATGLIACMGSPKITALGYLYVITPVMLGVIVLIVVAFLLNKEYLSEFKKQADR